VSHLFSDPGVYAAKTVIIVVFLLGSFRLLGKREMAQLTVYDLAMLMALANAVQNAMTGGKGALGNGVVVSSAVLVTAWLLSRVMFRYPAAEKRIIGSPMVLINDGVVLQGRLRHERIPTDELLAAVRAHGLEKADEVRLAVLEVDGSISIVPK
jgi:uncharacterized membrane protein YcaP (DUF421 family)